MSTPRVILASASPRRRELLALVGIPHVVEPADIDESYRDGEEAAEHAERLAREKAATIVARNADAIVIAADTIVLCGGVRMGKPAGEAEARKMLERLSGRSHEVVTGMALLAPPAVRIIDAESTRVVFRRLTAAEIERYIATGEPFDKAGAYAIQGYASAFIEKIRGCYFNVVGLPVARLFAMFGELERARAAPG